MHMSFSVNFIILVSVFTYLEVTGNEDNDGIIQELIPTQEEFEFPYQVSLHYSYNDDFICGGSIISPKIVLTAAHCMYYSWGGLLPPIIITVSAGRTILNDTALRRFDVASVILHPAFNKPTMENNLALIEINDKFPSSSVIRKVSLEKQSPEAQYNICVVSGWDQDLGNLQVVEVVIIDCENFPGNICTKKKDENETTCVSDAGNPLVCDGNLIGVLSVEPSCDDPSQLTIFENVRNSLSWLDEHGLSSASRINSYLFLLIVLIYYI